MLAWIDMQGRERPFLRYPFMQPAAPYLYGPRMRAEIDLGLGGEPAAHIRFPLAPSDWLRLQEPVKEMLCGQLENLCRRAGGLQLAAEQPCRTALSGDRRFLFSGEIFRWILLAVLAADYLRRRPVRRVILALPAEPRTEGLLRCLKHTGAPLVLQNAELVKTERLCWKLLQADGLAVSCSPLRPQNWQTGDLVAGFRPELRGLLKRCPGAAGLVLDGGAKGLNPELEERLLQAGLQAKLGVLAPMLEYYLLRDEPEILETRDFCRPDIWQRLICSGEKTGIWHSFLDKWEAGFI